MRCRLVPLFLSVLFGLILFGPAASRADDIAVEGAWVRAAPPGAALAAAYLEISNNGPSTRLIRSASSKCAKRVSIHRTVVENDVARMEPVSRLVLEPGETISFSPGGLHFMLENPRFEGLARCSMSITFHDGTSVEFLAEIRNKRAAPSTGGRDTSVRHFHHDHHDHGDEK